MRRRRRSESEAEINVTPLLDIVFIMLIFFIVTTSFVHEIGVEMNRSANEPLTTEDESEIILVRIDNDGQIYIRNRQTDIRLVHANIESSLASMPDAAVVVAAARNSDAGLLVKVVDQARVAGAQQVSMVALSEM
ncbi:MAG: biopolymer transporter ExbD [Gammaproteobacteria bacterium]|nr:MAG: biopolymer transporter ExbD [Gammaproteobacteria bacterium]RLA34565.1 MAG: biopolymer transporter ExbD [Gammaproteobacteria bacterium]